MRATPRLLSSVALLLVVMAIPHDAGAQANSTKTAPKLSSQPSALPQAPAPPSAPKPQNTATPAVEKPQVSKPAAATTPPASTPAAPTPAPAQAAQLSQPPASPAAASQAPTAQTGPGAASPGLELEPRGYAYEPAGRRDPFVSLLRRGSDVASPAAGSRVGGLAGLETSEVTLKGTFASRGEVVGIVQGVDNKTYIVKPGDRLLDGTVHTISPDSMVITQQVTDPLSLEKQREVRKLLRQTEEAK